jgi:hypothetical protein
VFVALGIYHAMRMRRIVICGLSGLAVFLDIVSQTVGVLKKKVIKNKMYFLILTTVFVRNISRF